MDLGHYLLILVSTVLVNNVVLVRILGLCPFMGVSKKLEAAIGMGAATTFVLTLAAGSSHLVNQLLIAGTMLGLAEALAYAKRSGLDPATVLESVGGGAAASWSLADCWVTRRRERRSCAAATIFFWSRD